jgi:DNA-binding transcriptional LysR family regulator
MMMDRLHSMEVFAAVADSGSFAKAARAMRLSPPAVTRAITALEDRLGTRLFLRTTRSVRLTEAGRRFLADAQRILQEIREAEETAAGEHAAPHGVLHVTAPVLFGRIYVAPILREFLDLYPSVTADTLFLDRVVNIVDEGMDVAIQIGELPDSSLTAIRVGFVRRVVYGAPVYFAKFGAPQHPSALAGHRVISGETAAPVINWRFSDGGTDFAVRVTPKMFVNNLDTAIESAICGWGLSRTLSYQIAPQVAEGRLQIILEAFEPPPLPIHIVHQEGRRASAKLRAFIDFTVDRLRAHPAIRDSALSTPGLPSR